jgi:HNH endonuclease
MARRRLCARGCRRLGIIAPRSPDGATVGSWDTVIASAVFERDDWTCHICGQEIPEYLRTVRTLSGYEPLAPVVDHKIPLSKGGPHTVENCCAAHWACNARKHNAPFIVADCVEVADLVLVDVGSGPVAAVERPDGERTGEQRPQRGRPRVNEGPCRLPGCNRQASVKQLCRAHYHRLNRYGDPLKGVCSCGCGEAVSVDPSWVGLFYIDGHGINIDPSNPSSKRRRCLTCVANAPEVTHCVNGHEYTDSTTEYTSKGQRNCVLCRLNAKHIPAHGHEYVIDPNSSPKKRRCLCSH